MFCVFYHFGMRNRGPVSTVLLAGYGAVGGPGSAFRPVADSEMIEAAVQMLGEASASQLIVVLGEPAGTLSFPIGAQSTTVKRHKEWTQGYRAAVAAGLRALAPDAGGVLFATCDLAVESARALRRLCRRFERGELGLYACHDGMRIHTPVLMARRYRDELLAMPDDAHLLDVVTGHPEDVEYVDILTPTPAP